MIQKFFEKAHRFTLLEAMQLNNGTDAQRDRLMLDAQDELRRQCIEEIDKVGGDWVAVTQTVTRFNPGYATELHENGVYHSLELKCVVEALVGERVPEYEFAAYLPWLERNEENVLVLVKGIETHIANVNAAFATEEMRAGRRLTLMNLMSKVVASTAHDFFPRWTQWEAALLEGIKRNAIAEGRWNE